MLTVNVKAGQHLWEPLLLSPILSAPEIVVPSMLNTLTTHIDNEDGLADHLY